MHGSDEEADDPPMDSDDDLSDDSDKQVHDEVPFPPSVPGSNDFSWRVNFVL